MQRLSVSRSLKMQSCIKKFWRSRWRRQSTAAKSCRFHCMLVTSRRTAATAFPPDPQTQAHPHRSPTSHGMHDMLTTVCTVSCQAKPQARTSWDPKHNMTQAAVFVSARSLDMRYNFDASAGKSTHRSFMHGADSREHVHRIDEPCAKQQMHQAWIDI